MSPNLTNCECRPNAFPFFCLRHGCTKIERWFVLCQSEPECFQNWENGVGHGQVRTSVSVTVRGDVSAAPSSGTRQSSGVAEIARAQVTPSHALNSGEFSYKTANNPGSPGPTESPALLNRVWNFARAVATHVAGGCLSVSTEEYAARLAVCDTCPDRSENVCLQCGCYISMKAHWRAMQCPLNKWPNLIESARDGP